MADKQSLKEQVALLPLQPGVYQFLDRTGSIIYVGKAKSLRKRVSSYFVESKEHSAKVRVLVKQIVEIRHIVVDTEQDALLLENSLIKSLQPRYNILLKDDKTYPCCFTIIGISLQLRHLHQKYSYQYSKNHHQH